MKYYKGPFRAYRQDSIKEAAVIQQRLSLLQSYPTVEDWIQLLYGYQPLKSHDLHKLHQYQELVKNNDSLIKAIECEAVKWFQVNLKQEGIFNTSLREHLDIENGWPASGVTLIDCWHHKLTVKNNGKRYEITMIAYVEGTDCLSAKINNYSILPVRISLPSRKRQDELQPVEHAKVIIKTSFKQLDASMIYVNGQILPTVQAYNYWQANRSWLNRKLYGNFSYQRWLEKEQGAVCKQSRYLCADSDNLNDLITDEVLTDQRLFVQQVKSEFSFLWCSLLGYPEICWGRPEFRPEFRLANY